MLSRGVWRTRKLSSRHYSVAARAAHAYRMFRPPSAITSNQPTQLCACMQFSILGQRARALLLNARALFRTFISAACAREFEKRIALSFQLLQLLQL